MYQKLIEEFSVCPRDVHTVPITNRAPKWFYVFVEKGKLCVSAGRFHKPACTLKKRILSENECDRLLSLYHRRNAGEAVSAEAQTKTYSQVYWYGLFAELHL